MTSLTQPTLTRLILPQLQAIMPFSPKLTGFATFPRKAEEDAYPFISSIISASPFGGGVALYTKSLELGHVFGQVRFLRSTVPLEFRATAEIPVNGPISN